MNISRSALAVALLMLSLCAATAQQASDWHPSLTDDNKAATWDDTISFITDTINNNPASFLITAPGGHLYDNIWITAHADKGEACHLQTDKYAAAFWGRGYEHRHDVIDLANVDPLSLKVAKETFSSDPKHFASGFIISFSGTSSKNVVDWKTWHYHDNFAWNTDIKPATTLFTCEGKAKNCKETSGQDPKEVLWVSDDETAKRLARALLHASVLCGGSKAVSPF